MFSADSFWHEPVQNLHSFPKEDIMKTYRHETTTTLPAHALYRAITAIERWPEWDHELARTEHKSAVAAGSPFMLQPKGGPRVKMEITAADEPRRFADVAHLPLAKMRTDHVFEEGDGETRMILTIVVSGPLAFLWDRVIARKQAAGAEDHARVFFAFAEQFA
jgi:Polyketide cyclase / dehydrase and lipid transport